MNILKEKYQKEIVPTLQKELGLKNPLAVPRLEKIVLNMGTGSDLDNQKESQTLLAEVSAIAGQKPQVRVARKAISGFKIRIGQPVGLRVTLRGERMYNFFQKLIWVVIPRVRDFRGLNLKGFDEKGSYSMGFKEQIIFPEIDTAKITKYRGLQAAIVTTAKNRQQTKRLLELFGMPFKMDESRNT